MGGILTACCVGGLVVFGLVQFTTRETIPPYIWARTADKQTREEVATAVAAAFNQARESAPDERNDALREATFHVPRELARLNKDAPDFRLEDLGPMVHANLWWDRVGVRFPSLAPWIDCGQETRVFLYFPNGATKATAVFVAINAGMKYPLQNLGEPGEGGVIRRTLGAAVEVSLPVCAWQFQQYVWARVNPAVVGRIEELERLPVIFNFREKAFGAMYYKRLELVLGQGIGMPLMATDLDRGVLQK